MLEDAYRMWNANCNQLFVYDDFLGQSTLEDKLYKNEDSRLISLMKRISADPTKRFICTTRSYILAQGKTRYERLDRENFEPVTCVVNLDDYDRETRARILYNHTFWSRWPASQKASLADPDNYRRIIDHPNFNPRVISDVLATSFNPSWGDVTTQLVASLDDPMRVWRHIFENQLTDADRVLLATLFSLGGGSFFVHLQEVLLAQEDWDTSRMRRSLHVLDGTFVKIYYEQSHQYIELSNPSINDFLIREMADDNSILRRVLLNARSFEQVANIWVYHPSSNICDHGDLYIDLHPLSHEIEDAALATLEVPTASTRGLVGRLVIALRVSAGLGLSRLNDRVADLISVQGRIYFGQYDDIAEMIRETAGSRNPQIRKHHKAILIEGLTALFNRDRSEKGVFTAGIYAHKLAEFVDEKVLDNIDAQAGEQFGHLMELYEFGSPDELDPDVFAEALRYISIFPDFYTNWPMAEAAMEDFRVEVNDADGEEDYEDDDPEWSDGIIYEIMTALMDIADQD
ncbi:hypothetical protein GCM10009555_015050 [Acrocarpospora macrocephala]|uniref:Novel STAND NTPase 3 domain-containing protein n=1 Tax=Acrocarpospora macrocephala TaxID=150177 RepID=A0A5M3X0F5_9ACTN|nr:hypothetical protein [Acrocarpospora macrocephala]GES14146.1 hypothetical protein Amac_077430 [Acrocarpospora macrocephala]